MIKNYFVFSNILVGSLPGKKRRRLVKMFSSKLLRITKGGVLESNLPVVVTHIHKVLK